MNHRLWQIHEQFFRPDQQRHFETLFTVGNGYMGTRGAFEEGVDGDSPATLIHGIYDHTPGTLVPELVNAPNWLGLRLTVDGTPVSVLPVYGDLLGYDRALDMRRALLRRELLFRAASGAIVRVVFERFASLDQPHMMAQRVDVSAVNGDPRIELRGWLDSDVSNDGVRHFRNDERVLADGATVGLEMTTAQSGYVVGVASRLVAPADVQSAIQSSQPSASTNVTLRQGETATVVKLTSIYTSRDVVGSPLDAALLALDAAEATGWDRLLAAHTAACARDWETADIVVEGDDTMQRALRFTTYHVLIAAPRHDDRVSIGAKTLSGMGYKGHVFWDTDLFIVPSLILMQPELARHLLLYRYHNLPGARHKAAANGYEGAMFPWESTDTGEETTPQWIPSAVDGEPIRVWSGDHEQHISTDIAYATWQYWRWTGDEAFLRRYGAEIILDTAVFWGSRVEARNGRYELSQQIGPDEYHENVDNPVFTNRMVVWHLQTALALLDRLWVTAPQDADRLTTALGLTDARLAHWRNVIAHMFIPFDAERQIHVQFPGFFALDEVPVSLYTPRTVNLWGILGHHRLIETQVVKQADVVMLMALLGDAVGTRDVMLNNWNTYYPRTDHGSSLSPAMHARVAARLGLVDEAYELLRMAAHIDLEDNMGNAADGIHAAACGGVWQAVVLGMCGLHIDADGQLRTAPHLPAHWRSVTFTVVYRGERQTFTLRPD